MNSWSSSKYNSTEWFRRIEKVPLCDIGAFLGVPGMARIQLEISQPQVFTAKCSEPQVVNSDVEDGGSGVAILSSVRTET